MLLSKAALFIWVLVYKAIPDRIAANSIWINCKFNLLSTVWEALYRVASHVEKSVMYDIWLHFSLVKAGPIYFF